MPTISKIFFYSPAAANDGRRVEPFGLVYPVTAAGLHQESRIFSHSLQLMGATGRGPLAHSQQQMPAGTSFNQRPICLCHYLRAVDLLRPAVHRDEGYTWLRELQTLVRMLTGVTVRELKSDAFKKSANN